MANQEDANLEWYFNSLSYSPISSGSLSDVSFENLPEQNPSEVSTENKYEDNGGFSNQCRATNEKDSNWTDENVEEQEEVNYNSSKALYTESGDDVSLSQQNEKNNLEEDEVEDTSPEQPELQVCPSVIPRLGEVDAHPSKRNEKDNVEEGDKAHCFTIPPRRRNHVRYVHGRRYGIRSRQNTRKIIGSRCRSNLLLFKIQPPSTESASDYKKKLRSARKLMGVSCSKNEQESHLEGVGLSPKNNRTSIEHDKGNKYSGIRPNRSQTDLNNRHKQEKDVDNNERRHCRRESLNEYINCWLKDAMKKGEPEDKDLSSTKLSYGHQGSEQNVSPGARCRQRHEWGDIRRSYKSPKHANSSINRSCISPSSDSAYPKRSVLKKSEYERETAFEKNIVWAFTHNRNHRSRSPNTSYGKTQTSQCKVLRSKSPIHTRSSSGNRSRITPSLDSKYPKSSELRKSPYERRRTLEKNIDRSFTHNKNQRSRSRSTGYSKGLTSQCGRHTYPESPSRPSSSRSRYFSVSPDKNIERDHKMNFLAKEKSYIRSKKSNDVLYTDKTDNRSRERLRDDLISKCADHYRIYITRKIKRIETINIFD